MSDKMPSGTMYHIVPDKSDGRTLAQKLSDLCLAFNGKHGTRPTALWAHPDILVGEVSIDGLVIVSDKRILRDHFLLGGV